MLLQGVYYDRRHAVVTAAVEHRQDLAAHPWLPKALEVTGGAFDGQFAIGVSAKCGGDLVGHLHELLAVHQAPPFGSSDSCMPSKEANCRCHSEGVPALRTCTAVTLYSGQLVAQSLFSVVTTFAPDSGWWNVV